MNETVIVQSLIYFMFFLLGFRMGKNMGKLENQKDDEE
mgnify:CR=1 FL=1|tara:strand:- start:925 stop:1038 length:114 start_codon:yes stop_codon:yes gene_type:complete